MSKEKLECFPPSNMPAVDYQKLQECEKRLELPTFFEASMIPTYNRYGFVTRELSDSISKEFVDFARQSPSQLFLEVGAGFGVATKYILNGGGRMVMNDLDARHLNAFASTLSDEALSRCKFISGAFPEFDCDKESLSGILMARVLLFLKGDAIERGLKKAWQWLKEDGKIFIVSATPYQAMSDDFLKLYEERERSNVSWPGEDTNCKDYYSKEVYEHLPEKVNLVDRDALRRALHAAGFKVQFLGYLDESRRTIGCVAQKKI